MTNVTGFDGMTSRAAQDGNYQTTELSNKQCILLYTLSQGLAPSRSTGQLETPKSGRGANFWGRVFRGEGRPRAERSSGPQLKSLNKKCKCKLTFSFS